MAVSRRPSAIGGRSPLSNSRQSQYSLFDPAPAPASEAGRPPDDALAGPLLPRNRRQLQAIPDRVAAPGRRCSIGWMPSAPITRKAGSRSIASSMPSASMPPRWRPKPSTRRHTTCDRRLGGGEGHSIGLRQYRLGRSESAYRDYVQQALSRSRTAETKTASAAVRARPVRDHQPDFRAPAAKPNPPTIPRSSDPARNAECRADQGRAQDLDVRRSQSAVISRS